MLLYSKFIKMKAFLVRYGLKNMEKIYLTFKIVCH